MPGLHEEDHVHRVRLAKEAYRFDDGWLPINEHSGATEQMHIQEGLNICRRLGRRSSEEA